MNSCAAGHTHGAIDRMYEDIMTSESAIEPRGRHYTIIGEWPT